MSKKIKIFRVVTNPSVVHWHMDKYLNRMSKNNNFCVTVLGTDVESCKDDFPMINFVNVEIKRKPSVFNDFKSILQLIKIFRAEKPDIVHSIMPKSGFVSSISSFLSGIDIRIHTFTGQMWNLKGNVRFSLLYWLDRLILKLNTHTLTDSPSQSKYLFEHGFNVKGDEIPYLGQGSLQGIEITSTDQTSQIVSIKNQFELESKFVFIFLARKTLEKGILDLLYAYSDFNSRIPNNNTTLLFVGPDDSKGHLASIKNQSRELFNKVVEVGEVSNPNAYLACSNVLILPSYREGFGSIVIDAALLSVPTIGTNIVGLKDAIVNEKTGILVPPGDRGQLTESLINIYESPSKLKFLADNANYRALKEFDSDCIHNQQINFYLTIFNESKSL